MSMSWEPPHFEEIAMNAEIGAYQDDFEPREVPIVERQPLAASAATDAQ
jgi:hypothetical protein